LAIDKSAACAAEAAKAAHVVRLDYQWGRALLAQHGVLGARRQFELALSKGYPAARIDLGNLLLDGTAGVIDPQRAVLLYEKAWRDGLPIAAFALGHLYETGAAGAGVKFHPDVAQAWAWYQKGADAAEPTALARFGERDEQNALTCRTRQKPMRSCCAHSGSTRQPPRVRAMRIGPMRRGVPGATGARRWRACSRARG
jgi:TPR repeat protein